MTTFDYCVGNLPIILIDLPYIYVCASISDVSKADDNPLGVWYYVILAIGLVLIIIVVVLIYIYARRELNKTLEEMKRDAERHGHRNPHNQVGSEVELSQAHQEHENRDSNSNRSENQNRQSDEV